MEDNKQLAILGLALSIVTGPIGIIVSAIALNKLKQAGETDGKAFAIAGIVVGAFYIAIAIIASSCIACIGCEIIKGLS